MDIQFALPDPALMVIMFIGGSIFFWSAMKTLEAYNVSSPPVKVRRYVMVTLAVLAFVTFILPIVLWRDLVGPESESFTLVFLPVVFRYFFFVLGMAAIDLIYSRDEE